MGYGDVHAIRLLLLLMFHDITIKVGLCLTAFLKPEPQKRYDPNFPEGTHKPFN